MEQQKKAYTPDDQVVEGQVDLLTRKDDISP
jgi:hypothetical protein